MKSPKPKNPIIVIACGALILLALVWLVITFIPSSGEDPMDLPVSTPVEVTDSP